MIGAGQARAVAEDAISRPPVSMDPLFAPWRDAAIGQPVLVRTVFGQPSYWLVPVEIRGRVAGFVRVTGEGAVSAVGALYADPARLDACPATVTGIDAGEARRRAEERIDPALGEVAAEPVFVHDGPPGREAWLIPVRRDGAAGRWIFVTPAFMYERRAGESLDETRE